MKCTIVFLITLAACHAADFEAGNAFSRQDAKPQSLAISWAAVAAANAADAATSWGRGELNPALGYGRFGARQAAIKGGVTAGAILLEYVLVRKYPRSARVFRILNFADAGVTGLVAAENVRTR
jgi:hypothetical protein